jgi:hypothetical protein
MMSVSGVVSIAQHRPTGSGHYRASIGAGPAISDLIGETNMNYGNSNSDTPRGVRVTMDLLSALLFVSLALLIQDFVAKDLGEGPGGQVHEVQELDPTTRTVMAVEQPK